MGVVLHVCEGNLCRSPMAERYMQVALAARFGWSSSEAFVRSAGIRAVFGQAMHPLAVAELERRGLPAAGFFSRPLNDLTLSSADLVMTATRAQRDDALTMRPSMLGRIFTWGELAWLLDGAQPSDLAGEGLSERITELPALAVRRRGYRPPPPPKELDLKDPMGGSAKDFRRTLDVIRSALDTVLAPL